MTVLWTGKSGVGILVRTRGFSLPWNVQTGSGTHRSSASGTKWTRHEVNHSLPSSAKVKNKWSFTSTSTIYIHSVERENFFTLNFISYCVNEMVWWSWTARFLSFVRRQAFHGNVRTGLHTTQIPMLDVTVTPWIIFQWTMWYNIPTQSYLVAVHSPVKDLVSIFTNCVTFCSTFMAWEGT